MKDEAARQAVSKFNPVQIRGDMQLESIQERVVAGDPEGLVQQLSGAATGWKSRDSNLLHLAIANRQIRIVEYLL